MRVSLSDTTDARLWGKSRHEWRESAAARATSAPGPGDPAMCEATIENVKWALEQDVPIFGICLGNQLIARAAGCKTYKLKFGNRGHNQPVKDLLTDKVT